MNAANAGPAERVEARTLANGEVLRPQKQLLPKTVTCHDEKAYGEAVDRLLP